MEGGWVLPCALILEKGWNRSRAASLLYIVSSEHEPQKYSGKFSKSLSSVISSFCFYILCSCLPLRFSPFITRPSLSSSFSPFLLSRSIFICHCPSGFPCVPTQGPQRIWCLERLVSTGKPLSFFWPLYPQEYKHRGTDHNK